MKAFSLTTAPDPDLTAAEISSARAEYAQRVIAAPGGLTEQGERRFHEAIHRLNLRPLHVALDREVHRMRNEISARITDGAETPEDVKRLEQLTASFPHLFGEFDAEPAPLPVCGWTRELVALAGKKSSEPMPEPAEALAVA